MCNIAPDSLSQTIQDAGDQAIHSYLDMSGNQYENEIREVILSSLIAINTHSRLKNEDGLKWRVRIEESYEKFVQGQDNNLEKVARTAEYGGQLADITLERGDRRAFIEVKIFDERRNALSIELDMHKISRLNTKYGAECYLAVFVTETKGKCLCERMSELGSVSAAPWSVRSVHEARAKGWYWCMAMNQIGATHEKFPWSDSQCPRCNPSITQSTSAF